MQTDQSTDSATATTRRTFLTRTAVGGALVTAGAMALPVSGLLTAAGARPGEIGTLKDADFAAFATPLELAAVRAYTVAFDTGKLDATWSDTALEFQSHHQQVADTLLTLVPDTEPTPVVDAALAKKVGDTINAAGTQDEVLLALSEMEDILAATHLYGVGALVEKSTAKTVAQVLSVEGQQAALLAVGAGTAIPEVTPPTSTDDAALPLPPKKASTTTTTTAAN